MTLWVVFNSIARLKAGPRTQDFIGFRVTGMLWAQYESRWQMHSNVYHINDSVPRLCMNFHDTLSSLLVLLCQQSIRYTQFCAILGLMNSILPWKWLTIGCPGWCTLIFIYTFVVNVNYLHADDNSSEKRVAINEVFFTSHIWSTCFGCISVGRCTALELAPPPA